MDIRYFATPADLRRWFEENHETATELQLGYYKKDSGKPSVTWAESVEQALCFGWIDGVRRSVDAERYTIRFTPRKSNSVWSAVNIATVERLTASGLMQPAGLKAFAARKAEKSAIYSFEQGDVSLDPAEEAAFRANAPAWDFFNAQAGSYRKACLWWVISAKKPETRVKRLAELIDTSAAGQTIRQFTPRSKLK
ncbi:MAG: YdeI/OmpD-associated family protein [Anaerolinea sp.]|nr:YdeI/OmpD-associated family protein [Anaerolinea sp.]